MNKNSDSSINVKKVRTTKKNNKVSNKKDNSLKINNISYTKKVDVNIKDDSNKIKNNYYNNNKKSTKKRNKKNNAEKIIINNKTYVYKNNKSRKIADANKKKVQNNIIKKSEDNSKEVILNKQDLKSVDTSIKTKNNRKPKIIFNIVVYILTVASAVLLIMFCRNIYKLDMLPVDYLKDVYVILGWFFLFQLIFIIPTRLRVWVKIVPLLIIIFYGVVSVIGFKYIDDTINFIDKVNDALLEKEEYFLLINKDSTISVIDDLQNKKIGFYNTFNKEKALQYLDEKINNELVVYEDLLNMFEDLDNNLIDSIYLNNVLLNLLSDDLSYLKEDFINFYTIEVPLKDENKDIVKVVNVTNTKFNIYIAGGDATGNINKVSNTDVNMIVSVDPVNKKILLTSIPRDYYVKLEKFNAYDKLTHAGYYGIETSINAVEDLLDIDINYYVKLNFSTLINVIDAIGGVDVYSDYNFTFLAYKHNKHNEFSEKYIYFKKGLNHMNGHQALAFVRERKAFPGGDVQRVKNQQKVLEAIIKKSISSTSILTNYSKLLESVSSSFSTNMNTEINRLVKMQISDMSNWTIEKQNLVGNSSTGKCYSYPNQMLWIAKPNQSSINKNKEKIKEFMEK